MPPSPQPPQPPASPERPGTLLETDEDVLQALRNKPNVELVPVPVQPPTTAAKSPSSAKPYRPTQRPPIALLTILDDGKGEGETVRLRGDRFVIGRTEGDLLIPHDPQISGRHIEITRQRSGEKYRWLVTDLQSTNGLFIRVSRTILADKAEILAGTGRYRFEAAGSNLPETTEYVVPGTQPGSTQPVGVDAASLMHPALVEVLGGKVLSRLPLATSEYWIGSDPTCAICRAGDPFVESRHIRLYREANGAWYAQNNKTSNGLWLKVPHVSVSDSCSFQIGEQRFRLNAGG